MSNTNNRVMVRAGARELTPQEVKIVHGNGRGTETLCTFKGTAVTDGDPGEC